MTQDESFQIEIPSRTRSEIIERIEAGEFPDWVYPKSVDETLNEYIESRRGQFDSTGFLIFPDPYPATVHHDKPVDTPPKPLIGVIEENRKQVFRESYTLRISFTDESWESVEDVWVDVYYVIEEPGH